MITADAGGSNGSRLRLWKTELAQFAAQTGLTITVCHLPPGTSKWNKIEQSCEVAENSFTGGDVGRVAAPPHFRRAGLAG